MQLWIILMVLGLHWVFDFYFQTEYQAQNKSRSLLVAAQHAYIYSFWGLIIPLIFLQYNLG